MGLSLGPGYCLDHIRQHKVHVCVALLLKEDHDYLHSLAFEHTATRTATA